MTAGVVLILVLLLPGGTVRSDSFPMPSLDVCRQAGDAFVRPEPDAHAIRQPGPTTVRYAHCLTLPAPGEDT
ncbi:MAG: hypothetical protein ACJ8FU_08520 [Xanthobacteraceae bacterium]